MRHWENEDVIPRPGNVFQERLYCIRWVETYIDDNGKEQTMRHYRAPTQMDLERETQVLALLKERFSEWQNKAIFQADALSQERRQIDQFVQRGWTYWHHLFNPRQLFTMGYP